jgi:hypothetical protein
MNKSKGKRIKGDKGKGETAQEKRQRNKNSLECGGNTGHLKKCREHRGASAQFRTGQNACRNDLRYVPLRHVASTRDQKMYSMSLFN